MIPERVYTAMSMGLLIRLSLLGSNSVEVEYFLVYVFNFLIWIHEF